MSAGKNFDLLREAVGVWNGFSDCVLKGLYDEGCRFVAWAESDAIGVRVYLAEENVLNGESACRFMALANAYVKWGAFIQDPESGVIVYKSLLTSNGDEHDRVNRVRDWLGYCLGTAKRFGSVHDSMVRGMDAKSAFSFVAHGDAGVRKRWLDVAPRNRGSTVVIDATYSQECRQIRNKMDEIETTGDRIDGDFERTICNRYGALFRSCF